MKDVLKLEPNAKLIVMATKTQMDEMKDKRSAEIACRFGRACID
jgi:hypothetical protein